jgi:hypothetical protein
MAAAGGFRSHADFPPVFCLYYQAARPAFAR